MTKLGAFLLTIAISLTPAAAHAQGVPLRSWSMYQFDITHNAVFESADRRVEWHTHLGASRINGGLSVVNDKLYVESFDRKLYSLDALTGHKQWEAVLPNIAMNTPLVDDGVVIVGTGNNSILADFGDSYVQGIPDGDSIEAFDVRTGALLWRFHTIGADMPTGSLMRYGGKTVFIFANGDGHARALDVRTGALLWDRPTLGSTAMSSVAQSDGSIFGTSGTFARFLIASYGRNKVAMAHRSWTWMMRGSDGQFVWTSPYGSQDCSPTLGPDAVYVEAVQNKPGTPVTSTDWYTEVDALDRRTGNLLWQYNSTDGQFSTAGSEENSIAGLYADGVFFDSLPYARKFAAFDAHTGAVLWQTATNAPVKMSAVYDDGLLYFGDTVGYLYVLRRDDGSILAKVKFPRIFTASPPLIVARTLYIANDSDVYAIPIDKLTGGQIPK